MECGDCTLCCTIQEIRAAQSPPGETCKHCQEGGCSIWGKHPKECKDYFCMWAQQEKASQSLRPDNCGVIFDKVSENIVLAKLSAETETLKDNVVQQIKHLMREGFSIVVLDSNLKRRFVFYGDGKQRQDVYDEIFKAKERWQHTHQT